jgi:hypothetical protein
LVSPSGFVASAPISGGRFDSPDSPQSIFFDVHRSAVIRDLSVATTINPLVFLIYLGRIQCFVDRCNQASLWQPDEHIAFRSDVNPVGCFSAIVCYSGSCVWFDRLAWSDDPQLLDLGLTEWLHPGDRICALRLYGRDFLCIGIYCGFFSVYSLAWNCKAVVIDRRIDLNCQNCWLGKSFDYSPKFGILAVLNPKSIPAINLAKSPFLMQCDSNPTLKASKLSNPELDPFIIPYIAQALTSARALAQFQTVCSPFISKFLGGL